MNGFVFLQTNNALSQRIVVGIEEPRGDLGQFACNVAPILTISRMSRTASVTAVAPASVVTRAGVARKPTPGAGSRGTNRKIPEGRRRANPLKGLSGVVIRRRMPSNDFGRYWPCEGLVAWLRFHLTAEAALPAVAADRFRSRPITVGAPFRSKSVINSPRTR